MLLVMARARLEYDDSGTTFYYFLLSFYALILLPVTYFLYPRKAKGVCCMHVDCIVMLYMEMGTSLGVPPSLTGPVCVSVCS